MISSSSQQDNVIENASRRKPPLKYISSDSSNSTGSISSLILSMAPLSLHPDDPLTTKLDSLSSVKTKGTANEKVLTNTTLMKQLSEPVRRCADDSVLLRSCSSSRSESCLHKLVLRPTLSNGTKQSPLTKSSSPIPIAAPKCIELSAERYNQYKQRQIELDSSVTKLIENIKTKSNETINQIPKYWSSIKQIYLHKYQSQSNNNFSLLDYLRNSTSFHQSFKDCIEQNDAIHGALEILSTTFNTAYTEEVLRQINQLFDTEEETMMENLSDQFQSLLSSYTDKLSTIRRRLNEYQTNVNEENKFNWIQIIQIDYPYLIENLSNDLIIGIPSIEQILVDMLRSMKKSLIIKMFMMEK